MNILLIHLNPLGKTFHIGLAYIASILEARKHNVAFLSLSVLDKNIILEEISRNKTEIILISVTSDSFELCKKIIDFVNKKTNIPILLGGIHPTLCPEDCIKLDGVLGLCIGEGEYPVCELLEAIELDRDYTNIKNLWIKKNKAIYKNDLRSLIQNLDVLPPPNYEIFKKYYKDFIVLPMILTRGCPFNCSYCCSHILRKLHEGKGNFLRHHSIPYSIELINHLLKQFPSVVAVEFFDDTFIINKEWLHNFLKEFSKLGIRFICNSRFDIIDEDLLKLLASSGCIRINAAVECGNEKIRKKILGRFISNKEIKEKSRLIKKYKIHLHTHNMLGIPYEEEKDILKTIELNKMSCVDSVQVSIFNPYPKTRLEKLCADKNWINKKLKPTSYCDFTALRTPFIKPHLVNYYFLIFISMIFNSGYLLHIKKLLCWIMHIHNNSLYIALRRRHPNILSRFGIKNIAWMRPKTNS